MTAEIAAGQRRVGSDERRWVTEYRADDGRELDVLSLQDSSRTWIHNNRTRPFRRFRRESEAYCARMTRHSAELLDTGHQSEGLVDGGGEARRGTHGWLHQQHRHPLQPAAR